MIWNSKSRKVCYDMRNEIEQIIKDENIDRKNFYEVSKFRYEEIIRKFYYTFFDYEKYPRVQLNYLWIKFRNGVQFGEQVCCDNWEEYIGRIAELVPDNDSDRQYYLILDYGWVYEGKLKEIQNVLYNTSVGLEDFYIISKKFEWMIAHSDDGDCMSLVSK